MIKALKRNIQKERNNLFFSLKVNLIAYARDMIYKINDLILGNFWDSYLSGINIFWCQL